MVIGCAHKEPNLSPKEMTEKACRFSKASLDDTPDKVVQGYLKRDAAGEFTLVSGWFDSATLCPGREAAPEISYVIRRYHAGKPLVSMGKATIVVEYDVIGLLEPGIKASWNFVRRHKKMKRTFELVHTSYGWRIQTAHLVDGQYLSTKTAKKRQSVVDRP